MQAITRLGDCSPNTCPMVDILHGMAGDIRVMSMQLKTTEDRLRVIQAIVDGRIAEERDGLDHRENLERSGNP